MPRKCEPLAERRAQPIIGIPQHAAISAHWLRWHDRSPLEKGISGFVRAVRYAAGIPALSNRGRLVIQLSGRNSRNSSMKRITRGGARFVSPTAASRDTIDLAAPLAHVIERLPFAIPQPRRLVIRRRSGCGCRRARTPRS